MTKYEVAVSENVPLTVFEGRLAENVRNWRALAERLSDELEYARNAPTLELVRSAEGDAVMEEARRLLKESE